MSVTNITTAAWTTVLAALTSAGSAMEVFNESSQPITLAMGAAGSEVAIPYTILPGGTVGYVPVELFNKARLSAKATGANVATGYLIVNMFA